MKLHEYQSKARFAAFGIPTPPGQTATTPAEVYEIALHFGGPVAIKSQVLAGSRGRAGGIRIATTADEARQHATEIMNAPIQGLVTRQLLIEPVINIRQEIYLGITNDRIAARPVLIASAAGGIDIDHVANRDPAAIMREYIDPILGLRAYQITHIASDINLPRHLWRPFRLITRALYACYLQSDASLAEINPLAITEDEEFIAVDGKLIIDDNALYRHPDLAALRDVEAEHQAETLARKARLSYIRLDGQIGCLVNGAGLGMTVMDMINDYGSEEIGPANFLDIGGGADASRVSAALHIVLADPDVRSVLVNIFGGMTRCDEVAAGLIQIWRELKPDLPFIIRFEGTNAYEGWQLIEEANLPNIHRASSLTQLVRLAVEAAQATKEARHGNSHQPGPASSCAGHDRS